MSEYITSVGMEVHAELLTESKMFCRCKVAFGGEPNTRVCPICLGMPGTLPVPNKKAIELVIRTALALNCTIAMDSVFHRKNYFYPDLPKGYQVSQYGETNPIGYKGWLEIPTKDGSTKKIHIRRVHLEEDTGKLMHLPGGGSGVDYNRAGVPLMEIVSDFPPDIESSDEAKEYLVQLRSILVWLGVCDGKMEEGSLRCEPNISIRPVGSSEFGTKTELKNLNSFRSVQLGVAFETKRQAEVLEQGGTILQETRGWNENSLSSYVMRVKESEQEYRYFPCPDLVPMKFEEGQVGTMRAELPELPLAKWKRFQSDFGLTPNDADVLTQDRSWAQFFEECVALGKDPKGICNLMNGDFLRLLNESGQTIDQPSESNPRVQTKVTPQHIAELEHLLSSKAVNSKIAKQVMEEMFHNGSLPKDIVESKGLTQVSDTSFISDAVSSVIASHPNQVAQYRAGKEGLIGFLVGAVMKDTQGRANPAMVQEEMRRQLKGS